jgi:hypothetical protein
MTVLTSTVPGAITTLQTHLQNVAAANPSLEAAVYLGLPTQTVTSNYLMIGSYPNGEIVDGYESGFAAIPGASKLKSEEYNLLGHIRTWAGNVQPADRIADAFTLLDGLLEELTNDIGGSGQLTPSGSWQVAAVDNPLATPMSPNGWGFVLAFTVHVWNVQITSS